MEGRISIKKHRNLFLLISLIILISYYFISIVCINYSLNRYYANYVDKTQVGLRAFYYNSSDFSGDIEKTEVVRDISYSNSTDKEFQRKDFTLRLVGIFYPPKKGHYKFFLRSDDGSRLFIDQDVIIDNAEYSWVHPSIEKCKTVFLKKRPYLVCIEYLQVHGEAELDFSWLNTGKTERTNNLGMFFHPVVSNFQCADDINGLQKMIRRQEKFPFSIFLLICVVLLIWILLMLWEKIRYLWPIGYIINMLTIIYNAMGPNLLSLLHLSFLIASYLFVVWPFFSNTYNVRYDNWEYYFRYYTYDSNSLLHGFGFPRWYPYEGGVPQGVLHIMGSRTTLPGILGDLLYIVFPLQPMTAYKFNIALSMIIIGIGWWLFLYQLIRSRLSATVGCLTLLLGMTSVIAFDVEQVIPRMLYIPWILLVLIQIKKQFEYILILAVLIGLSMSIRCPIYYVLTLSFLFIPLILTGRLNFLFTAEVIKKKIFVLLFSFVLFVAAASPVIYTVKVKKDFYAPFDKARIIEAESFKSFEEYVKRAQLEPRVAIRQYLDTHIPKGLQINDMPTKITIVQMILVVIGAFYFRLSFYAIIVLIFSVWATIGINGSFPYILYTIKFPFIKYFRAWWEFSCAVNLCLSCLASLGFASLLYLSRKAFSLINKITSLGMVYNNLLVMILSTVIVVPLIYFSETNANIYIKYFSDWPDLGVPRFDKNQFTEALKSNLFGKINVGCMYNEWWDLLEECPELTTPQQTSKPPFITRRIYNNVNNHSDFMVYLKPFYNLGLYSYSVIASIPLEEAKDIKMDIREIPEDWVYDDSNLIKNRYFHVSEFQLSPYGITLEMQTPEIAMAVLPYNYKLGLKVYLDNKRVKTYPVYNGAMIGVFLPEGKSNLYAKMPFSLYEFTVLIQAILIVFVFVYLIYDFVRRKNRVNGKFLLISKGR